MNLKINVPWIKGKLRCQNGYVYIDQAFWNTKTQQSNHVRIYIGKYNGETFTPNKTYYRLEAEYQQNINSSKSVLPGTDKCIRKFYGATYLLDQISMKTGIKEDLHNCFPDLSNQILSLVYYLVLEEGRAMYRFYKWGATHIHPYNQDILSQRISEIFGMITEETKMKYFKLQANRHSLKEYLAFDTTSISSYSNLIKQVKYGKNKEHDLLPQINLALLYAEENMLPIYYKKLAGNITDVKIIENLLKDFNFLNLKHLKLVLDRGFYSEKNINDLIKNKHEFLIGVKKV